MSQKPCRKIGDYQSFGKCCGKYQLVEIQLSGGEESQTDTCIVDYYRIDGYTDF